MIQIIPAIDIINGQCVRLTQGDYSQKRVYDKDPIEMAQKYADEGFQRLHVVDLDGAKSGAPKHLALVEQMAAKTNLTIDYGGGIKTTEQVQAVLDAGAAMANIGSLAVKQPEVFKGWLQTFGSDKILLASDVKGEKIAINAWQDESEVSIYDFIADFIPSGLTQFFCTDVSKDGLLQGVALELYCKLKQKFPTMTIIASGGVASMQDIEDLNKEGIDGVIVGKAIYENRIALEELKQFA
ncbi:1-(5-phosphoribosyl)-5-[(5-phosphoribosylamino)methylideneamino]imidazole-4-carboxamide isomerase [Microscilla marina]|uniref:1-(5-phosphoribosyl)-5-[(5-phosphoribosylamino)methylideneamino] imidazole-4-carboxamide isomerase n=1 Tax=Microscilla marina ATCC 23134 TaxID=313606 RepID=A1ZT22_MICM2|nr:1-(5-phosphoribosyl)-5-[(5-phosphoribosylamino)methylideneamino]imidazole-4-carboxamide isomerase [Microscilla marina]EAY26412.1 phosphoribosylformimino-5-aminoimidazole carboxamide ribotide isomerase [Microscilla marina ATCC 23134]